MSEKEKEETNADAADSKITPPAAIPLDSRTNKQNNELKNRLRKYIKKLDSK